MSGESDLDSLAQTCSERDNGVSFCSPESTDVWVNGTSHYFIWKYNNPFYVASTYLDIYLYYIINYAYVNVKTLSNLTTNSGGVNVTIDDSWFIRSSTTAQNLTMYAYILPSTANSTKELTDPKSLYPLPSNFTITQSATPVVITTTSPSPTNTDTNTQTSTQTTTEQSQDTNASSIPGWAIAIIVIGAVALLCGLALIWLWFLRRKQSPAPSPPPKMRAMPDTTSMNSQTPMYRPTDSAVVSSSLPRPVNTLESIPSEEEDDEETHRRRLGEALLKKQLEEDGTFVKHAGRFTHVKSLDRKSVV